MFMDRNIYCFSTSLTIVLNHYSPLVPLGVQFSFAASCASFVKKLVVTIMLLEGFSK